MLHGGSLAFQVPPPEPFVFARPEEWPKWIRRFERFRLATGLEENQISTFIYCTWASEPVRQVRWPPDQYFPKINIIVMN